MLISNLPFKDLIYDCQNLAFLFGDSLYPIMARCCLNIFADFLLLVLVCCKETKRKSLLKYLSVFSFFKFSQKIKIIKINKKPFRNTFF